MDSKFTFLALMVVSTISVVVLMLPPAIPSVPPRDRFVRVTTYTQSVNLTKLSDAKERANPRFFYVNKIDFPEGTDLRHKKIGAIGLNRHFLMELECRIKTLVSGEYLFTISSDDGFELSIDQRLVSSFITDRANGATSQVVTLSAGYHDLLLKYFQGGGPLALRATYGPINSKEEFLIGEHSAYLVFDRWVK